MQYVLIIHEVTDYSTWKKIFDEAAGIRKAAGEIHYQLLRFDSDKNNVVHFSECDRHGRRKCWERRSSSQRVSLENARRFFESPEVVEIRKQAGVKAPEFLYLEEIESGML